MLRTNRRFPQMSFSRASRSPALERSRSDCFSSSERTSSFAVFTPQISTFFIYMIKTVLSFFRGSAFHIPQKQYLPAALALMQEIDARFWYFFLLLYLKNFAQKTPEYALPQGFARLLILFFFNFYILIYPLFHKILHCRNTTPFVTIISGRGRALLQRNPLRKGKTI